MIKRFGYDLERGRLDKTHHPFCTRFSSGDVRITTRVRDDDLSEALFSTLHEAGHALYEQGVSRRSRRHAAGLGRLRRRAREPVAAVGERGRPQPRLLGAFLSARCARPSRISSRACRSSTFYRAINKVERSLIRTDADEVTYNLHVMMRFDLELALLEGRLAVKDLPEAWRARFKEDFGIAPPDDRDGCLQDVHWYAGTVGGAFQGYAIGNILCAQFYAAALAAHPEIPERDGEGRVRHAARLAARQPLPLRPQASPDELIERATGKPHHHRALHRLPARQVRRALSAVALLGTDIRLTACSLGATLNSTLVALVS